LYCTAGPVFHHKSFKGQGQPNSELTIHDICFTAHLQ
jgi:hypothetical protein